VKGRQAGNEDGGSRHITGGPLDRWKPQSTAQVRDSTIILRAMN